MKNKVLCRRCKYRGTFGSRNANSKLCIVCDYAATANDGTCLKRVKGGIVDRRGNDYDTCLLYEEGCAIGRARNSKDYQGTILNRGERND